MYTYKHDVWRERYLANYYRFPEVLYLDLLILEVISKVFNSAG